MQILHLMGQVTIIYMPEQLMQPEKQNRKSGVVIKRMHLDGMYIELR